MNAVDVKIMLDLNDYNYTLGPYLASKKPPRVKKQEEKNIAIGIMK